MGLSLKMSFLALVFTSGMALATSPDLRRKAEEYCSTANSLCEKLQCNKIPATEVLFIVRSRMDIIQAADDLITELGSHKTKVQEIENIRADLAKFQGDLQGVRGSEWVRKLLPTSAEGMDEKIAGLKSKLNQLEAAVGNATEKEFSEWRVKLEAAKNRLKNELTLWQFAQGDQAAKDLIAGNSYDTYRFERIFRGDQLSSFLKRTPVEEVNETNYLQYLAIQGRIQEIRFYEGSKLEKVGYRNVKTATGIVLSLNFRDRTFSLLQGAGQAEQTLIKKGNFEEIIQSVASRATDDSVRISWVNSDTAYEFEQVTFIPSK